MIKRESCTTKEASVLGIKGQIGMDNLVHYKTEYQVTEDEIIRRIINYVDKNNLDMDYYPGCSEHGYDDRVVLAANWNGPSSFGNHDYVMTTNKQELTEHGKKRKRMAKLSHYIDSQLDSVSLEWSDEWTGCSDCGKAVRQSPDSYSWEPSWVWASDGEIVCRECWKDSLSDIIEHYKSDYHYGFSNKALPSDFIEILENEGFTCWQAPDYKGEISCARYETGFHRGQDDDPKKVFKEIMEDSHDWIVIFVITGKGQFDISWTAFIKREVEED